MTGTITPERWDAVRAYIYHELKRRYPSGFMPPRDQLVQALAEICAPMTAEPIDVSIDAEKGSITISASVGTIEQLQAVLRQSAT